ncbi:DeoR family transcriptional regulator, partial [Streptomyces pseudogriseolus]
MSAGDRLDLTLRLVQNAGKLSVSELAERLGVSEMTVRRDLNALESQGLLRRVHGGAVPVRARDEGGG